MPNAFIKLQNIIPVILFIELWQNFENIWKASLFEFIVFTNLLYIFKQSMANTNWCTRTN